MAQTYKMMLGTSGKQWEQLTVKDDGTMTMYFHGTDRSVTQEVTVITEGEWKGWLRSEKGSLWPGLESGRWNKMADVQGTVPAVGSEAESERTTEGLSPMCAEPAVTVESALRGQAPCNPSSTSHTGDSPRESGNEWLLSAGYLAAATVALFVIYETGLLIPLGLIGLATGGILK